MIERAWRLPWNGQWVPHALLDIIRGCNLSCRACYNSAAPNVKTLEQVRHEFELLLRHRKLDSVSIVGGEPTLHPQLSQIIRMIKMAGISVELFTNGLLLEAGLLAELKMAGTDLIFLHIDAQQNRPDLAGTTVEQLRSLRAAKAAAVAHAGMEVGLAITAYDDALVEIDSAVEFVLTSPHVDYLLVTLCRDVQQFGQLRGDLSGGMRGEPPLSTPSRNTERLSNTVIYHHLRDRYGLEPFAYLGSNVNSQDPRWLSYMIGAAVGNDRPAAWSMLRPSAAERLFVMAHRKFRGRYPFYIPQSPARFRVQLLLNALLGGAAVSNLGLVARSFVPGRILRAKRLLFQCPAELSAQGTLIHCEHCPDATVRHDKLVPVCISDQVIESGNPEEGTPCHFGRT